MNDVFVDTSFYVAVSNLRDSLHAKAVDVAGKLVARMVTTEFILLETGNSLCRTGDRDAFVKLLDDIEQDFGTRVIRANHKLFQCGTKLFARRGDKNWSLTDCISFEVMRRKRIRRALTADHHFQQAGFDALLR